MADAVELTAVAARKVVDSVINNTGVIEANTIGTHNGMIVLEGGDRGEQAGRRADANGEGVGQALRRGKAKGTTGGTIVVTGENVQVSGAAHRRFRAKRAAARC